MKRVVLQNKDVFDIVWFKWANIPRGHMCLTFTVSAAAPDLFHTSDY